MFHVRFSLENSNGITIRTHKKHWFGVNPASIHFPNNEIWLFNVSSGRLKAKKWLPVSGDVDWSSPNFTDETIATSDKALSLYRLKNIPRVGAFGAWHQDEIEVNGRIISNERQRLGNMGCGE